MASFLQRLISAFCPAAAARPHEGDEGAPAPLFGFITAAEAADPTKNVAIYRYRLGGSPPYRGTTVHEVRALPAPGPQASVQALVQGLLALAGIPPAGRHPRAECYATPLAQPLTNDCPFPDEASDPAAAAAVNTRAVTYTVTTSAGTPALRLGAQDGAPLAAVLAGSLRLTPATARFSVVLRREPSRPGEPLRGDIGVFVMEDIGVFVGARGDLLADVEVAAARSGHAGGALAAPGAAWLQGPLLPSPLPPPSAVAAVAAAAVAAAQQQRSSSSSSSSSSSLLPPLPPQQSRVEVVPAPARAALVALGIAAGSTRDDFKLLLLPAQLRACIGARGARALAGALGGPPHAIALRRTAATGRWINFHADAAGATVQVPLSGDGACEGGRLVFAEAGGALRSPARRPGVPLAHSGDQVHGVTRLLRGVRYGLFLLRARPGEEGLLQQAA